MSGHFLFHLFSPVALLSFCPSSLFLYNILSVFRLVGISFLPAPLHGCELTCPNSLLFRVKSLRPHSSILALVFSSLSALCPSSSCPRLLSLQFTSLHDLYSDSHFNYCSFFKTCASSHTCFYHLSYFSLSLSASFSPSQDKKCL